MHVGENGDRIPVRNSGNQVRAELAEMGVNSGIRRNQTESELIPGAEPVPQCSTLRNRMYSINCNAKNSKKYIPPFFLDYNI